MSARRTAVLGIDTSTGEASLALVRNGRELESVAWQAGSSQSVEVPPRLDRMLGKHGLVPGNLGGVAVGLGPGAFTSLRVGLSLAKGMAMGANLPLVGVPTLEAMAAAHADPDRRVWVLLSAGRGRFCAARFAGDGGTVRREGGYLLGNVEELAGQLRTGSMVVGDLDAVSAEALSQRLGPDVKVVGSQALLPRALAVARVGEERLAVGEVDDPSSLEPIYLPSPAVAA